MSSLLSNCKDYQLTISSHVLRIYQSELKEKQRAIVLTFRTAAKFNTLLYQRISNSRKVTPLSLINVKQTTQRSGDKHCEAMHFKQFALTFHSVIFYPGYCYLWYGNKVWRIALAWDKPKTRRRRELWGSIPIFSNFAKHFPFAASSRVTGWSACNLFYSLSCIIPRVLITNANWVCIAVTYQ